MDPSLGLIATSGWASGVNLYLVVTLLGAMGRFGGYDTPEIFQRPEVLAAAAALFALEFVVDKVPYLDSVWDSIHTVIRPAGASMIGSAIATEDGSGSGTWAAILAGTLAVIAHVGKALGRLVINLSPEPVSNAIVSLGEDGAVGGVMYTAIVSPWVALGIVAVLLVLGSIVSFAAYKAVKYARSGARSRQDANNQRLRNAWGKPGSRTRRVQDAIIVDPGRHGTVDAEVVSLQRGS